MRRLALAAAALAVGGCGGNGQTRPGPTPVPTRPARHRTGARARPGPHPLRGPAARRAAVPVLTYHVIEAAPAGTPYPDLWIAPERFARHMAALRRHGFRGVTLGRVLAAWRGRAVLPRHPVVISFDDGYRSQWRAAFPVLRRLDWPAVLDLEVSDLGSRGLEPAHIRQMLRAGWEVDSHTVTHPDLTLVGAATLRRELVASRRILRRRFGPRAARVLCYPAGRHDAAAEAAARAAGYDAATTTDPGWIRPGSDRYALPRIRVAGTQSARAVLAQVAAARP